MNKVLAWVVMMTMYVALLRVLGMTAWRQGAVMALTLALSVFLAEAILL